MSFGGAQLAEVVEHATLDLGGQDFELHVGGSVYIKKNVPPPPFGVFFVFICVSRFTCIVHFADSNIWAPDPLAPKYFPSDFTIYI